MVAHSPSGLFSFKNNRLIGFTVSLSCRSGRAQRNPTGIKRVGFPFALPDLQCYYNILTFVINIAEKPKTE